MDRPEHIYLCIDLKSFYASVECVERGLDPLATDLVVADPERTEKTICLAITPSMKAKGIHNRCRVFEIPRNIKYIMAPPRMSLYIQYAANIYAVYLKYLSKDDIYVYSIDEAFLDVTDYLGLYNLRASRLAERIIGDIYDSYGITATCGIGTNLYLAKIALDISAKNASPNANGARIGMLTEPLFQKTLWSHTPLSDFWRIGPGIEAHLNRLGLHCMADIAHADEDMLYREFGVDAELLIDHAWGRETVTMADIKAYKPVGSSMSTAQVLGCGADYPTGLLVVKEMADSITLDLGAKGLAASGISLYLGYEADAGASGSLPLDPPSSSAKVLMAGFEQLYDRIALKASVLRRVNICVFKLVDEALEAYDLFADPEQIEKQRRLNQTLRNIKDKYGKNAILKAMSLEQGARQIERNSQIGGHKA
ncbi:MAG: DNA methylase [Sphaerochaetaceae bacterium]|nr:DNA methylase [Sphaerochaetaceae bacterium]